MNDINLQLICKIIIQFQCLKILQHKYEISSQRQCKNYQNTIKQNKNQKSQKNLINNPNKIEPETLILYNNQLKSYINSLSDEVEIWKLKYHQL
ncbi:unnamed protein product [Paramecium sonneborni]|uniref:Uncharacterized protein n=1 Tax=Paramecium sonneborni TaxID=65129 RepID=A0A8S1NJT8_9CILI|nr:unnamed protein product [Paramecium sonneborni]